MSSFKPQKTPKWFAIDETLPLVTFAGIWTSDGLDGLSSLRTGAVSYDRRLTLSAYRRLEVEQQR
jgi:putative SOS response-associated peptidase YedK